MFFSLLLSNAWRKSLLGLPRSTVNKRQVIFWRLLHETWGGILAGGPGTWKRLRGAIKNNLLEVGSVLHNVLDYFSFTSLYCITVTQLCCENILLWFDGIHRFIHHFAVYLCILLTVPVILKLRNICLCLLHFGVCELFYRRTDFRGLILMSSMKPRLCSCQVRLAAAHIVPKWKHAKCYMT